MKSHREILKSIKSLKDFFDFYFQNPSGGLQRGSKSNIIVSYIYNGEKYRVPNCAIRCDLESDNGCFSIDDQSGIIHFSEYKPEWQDFIFDKSTGTFKISGTDKNAGVAYSISFKL